MHKSKNINLDFVGFIILQKHFNVDCFCYNKVSLHQNYYKNLSGISPHKSVMKTCHNQRYNYQNDQNLFETQKHEMFFREVVKI